MQYCTIIANYTVSYVHAQFCVLIISLAYPIVFRWIPMVRSSWRWSWIERQGARTTSYYVLLMMVASVPPHCWWLVYWMSTIHHPPSYQTLSLLSSLRILSITVLLLYWWVVLYIRAECMCTAEHICACVVCMHACMCTAEHIRACVVCMHACALLNTYVHVCMHACMCTTYKPCKAWFTICMTLELTVTLD